MQDAIIERDRPTCSGPGTRGRTGIASGSLARKVPQGLSLVESCQFSIGIQAAGSISSTGCPRRSYGRPSAAPAGVWCKGFTVFKPVSTADTTRPSCDDAAYRTCRGKPASFRWDEAQLDGICHQLGGRPLSADRTRRSAGAAGRVMLRPPGRSEVASCRMHARRRFPYLYRYLYLRRVGLVGVTL